MVKFTAFLASIEGRYARTLYEVAKSINEREMLLNEMKSFLDLMENHQDLKKALITSLVHTPIKLNIAQTVLKAEKYSKLFTDFALLIIKKNRFNLLSDIYKNFEKLQHQEANIIDVRVVTAKEPSKEEKKQFTEFLNKNFDGNLSISFAVDENIIAGYRVHFPTKVLDASLSRQLYLVQHHILEGNL